MEENRKALLKITGLKQYFPLKKKGMWVKANDGIDLTIYKDETFGLVGESGCGKSTFGRTILQLYNQTAGRTIYYGRSRQEFAPEYVRDTLKNLKARRQRLDELTLRAKQAGEEFTELLGEKAGSAEQDGNTDSAARAGEYGGGIESDEFAAKRDIPGLYEKAEEYAKADQEAEEAYQDLAHIIGGFVAADDMDLDRVAECFLRRYEAAAGKGKEETKKERGTKQAKWDGDQSERDDELERAEAEIREMAKEYRGNSEFERGEACLDDGIDLSKLTGGEMRRLRQDLQLIFQDPYSSLNPRMTVGQIIGEGLMAHGIYRKNDDVLREYILKVMQECGLAPYMLHRYPHQFSGGQRQRIGIARSLALKPKFVVCDEAVSALDVSIQSQILNLLMELKEQAGLTYLFISHDLSVVKYLSDRIGVMYLGNLVELAPTQDLFANTMHPYTEALLKAIPTTDADSKLSDDDLLEGDIPNPADPPRGCKFHTRCPYATDICEVVTPPFEEAAPGHFAACHHKLGRSAKEGGVRDRKQKERHSEGESNQEQEKEGMECSDLKK